MRKWDEHERQDRLQANRERREYEELGVAKRAQAAERLMTTAEKVKAAGHKHGEAFCLMLYACEGRVEPGQTFRSNDGRLLRSPGCGHRELIWNSRDGVTPFCMGCPSCGGDLRHTSWQYDRYAPDHEPHHGQGIWRDGTPDEAEMFVRYRVAKYPNGLTPEYIAEMVAVVRDPDSERNTEFRRGWPMFDRWDAIKGGPVSGS